MTKVRSMVISKATLSSKGQLTLPVEVRRAMRMEKGDRVVFEVRSDGVLMRKALRASDLIGVLPPLPVDWKTARRQAWAERARRLAERSSVTRTSSSGS